MTTFYAQCGCGWRDGGGHLSADDAYEVLRAHMIDPDHPEPDNGQLPGWVYEDETQP